MASGRFLSVGDGTALYAVPDRGLLTRAEAVRSEVEDALSAHFGRRVPLQFILDEGSGPDATGPGPDGGRRADRAGSGPSPGQRAARPVVTPPTGGPRPAEADPAGDDDDPSQIDLDELEDAPSAVLSPEERLLEAFPGAEEVSQ